ncbi:PGN_0703 family putative restriction endonuclease [Nocardioides sp.]|uniref:PGN_0703 family putative restriction endonuclease n=1 Tax=Nocardioides sp. TaxID=35761 RepID=UPI002B276216|nr:hypothetical protein [Nocardioides sp.]
MTSLDAATPWHDERWREKGDNPLQAGLRLQQAWWRQECLAQPEAGHAHPVQPGKKQPKRNQLVSTMLPETVEITANLMTDEAVAAYGDAKDRPGTAPHLIQEDRLRRDLLASQPLCFNLFGHLAQAEPDALLPWVQTFAPDATRVAGIRLGYAPSAAELGEEPLGTSAFDAFIEYDLPEGRLGFVGVQTMYAEDLSKGLALPPAGSAARAKYVAETELRDWQDGAADVLLGHRRNLQFWYHQLLAQRTRALVKADDGSQKYAENVVVVVASRLDTSARSTVDKVARLLGDDDRGTLRFCTLEDVIDAVEGHEPWKHSLWQRYTDFTPVQRELAEGSPLRES